MMENVPGRIMKEDKSHTHVPLLNLGKFCQLVNRMSPEVRCSEFITGLDIFKIFGMILKLSEPWFPFI